MIKNYSAVRTLLRNRLNENKPIHEKIHWFHEKGVSIKIEDEDLFTLKKEVDGHYSEIVDICQRGLIYRGLRLICFMGTHIPEVKFSDIGNYPFSWDENTVFMDVLEGRNIYMYYDPKIKNWAFSDDMKSISSYRSLVLNKLYNVMNIDPAFTYHFKIVEKGKVPGLYLWTMYDTNKGLEMNYQYVDKYSVRLKVEHQNAYKFEGLDKIEEQDLPLFAQDSHMRTIKIVL